MAGTAGTAGTAGMASECAESPLSALASRLWLSRARAHAHAHAHPHPHPHPHPLAARRNAIDASYHAFFASRPLPPCDTPSPLWGLVSLDGLDCLPDTHPAPVQYGEGTCDVGWDGTSDRFDAAEVAEWTWTGEFAHLEAGLDMDFDAGLDTDAVEATARDWALQFSSHTLLDLPSTSSPHHHHHHHHPLSLSDIQDSLFPASTRWDWDRAFNAYPDVDSESMDAKLDDAYQRVRMLSEHLVVA